MAGFQRIPNVLQLTQQLEKRFKKEIEAAELVETTVIDQSSTVSPLR